MRRRLQVHSDTLLHALLNESTEAAGWLATPMTRYAALQIKVLPETYPPVRQESERNVLAPASRLLAKAGLKTAFVRFDLTNADAAVGSVLAGKVMASQSAEKNPSL